MPGRLISDSVLLAHELLEFIRKKKEGKTSFFALKLDMNKAYNRVSWGFLIQVLEVMGFSPRWIQLIFQCISIVSFSILINYQRTDWFQPRCG